MPTINFELVQRAVQYDMDPGDYMLMPYINYTDPVLTQCIFAIDGYRVENTRKVLTFGQRFLAKFPLMVVYDR